MNILEELTEALSNKLSISFQYNKPGKEKELVILMLYLYLHQKQV